MARGKIVLVLGSTGSGKSVLIEHIRHAFPDVVFVKSYTTRERRSAVENESYVFLSREAFEEEKAQGAFVEWAQFGKNCYGTSKKEIEDGLALGKVLLKEMEVQGVRQMLALFERKDLKLVFIDAGSWDELEKRARARGSITDEELALRKQRYLDEQPFMQEADVVVRNADGKLDEAKEAFEAALRAIINEIE